MKRKFSAKAFAADRADDGGLLLYLYDDIGASWFSEGITAKSIAQSISAAGDGLSGITMRINSPGGDVFEGLAIYNLVRSQGVPVTVMVDGVAASAASIIAMAGQKIVMAENALLMIHNAWMVAIGDPDDLRKSADTLEKISDTLVATYAARSGKAASEIAAMMDAETWLNAQEAVDQGFATEIFKMDEDDDQDAQALAGSFRLSSRFKHAPPVAPPTSAKAAEPAHPAAVGAFDLSALELDLRALELSAIR